MTKVLVATQKPFAAQAVEGIREIVKDAGYELALLENMLTKAICWRRLPMQML